MGDEAAALHAGPRRWRRVWLVFFEDGPVACHAEVDVNANVPVVAGAEPRE